MREVCDQEPRLGLEEASDGAGGRQGEEHPLDVDMVEEVMMDLRIACKEAGHGNGLPQVGDVVQASEIRLIESLLLAFGDPDWYV